MGVFSSNPPAVASGLHTGGASGDGWATQKYCLWKFKIKEVQVKVKSCWCWGTDFSRGSRAFDVSGNQHLLPQFCEENSVLQ